MTTSQMVAHYHSQHLSVVRAIRQCKGLERLIAVEQTPETLHTRVQLCLPRDVGELEEEVFDTLGIGRAHEVVKEYLEVWLGRVRRVVGPIRDSRGVRRPARLGDVHLRLVRERVGHIHISLLEEGERPVCRGLDGRPGKPRVHVGHSGQNPNSSATSVPRNQEINAHPKSTAPSRSLLK